MSIDIDPDILDEEYFEDMEKKLGVPQTNAIRFECGEEPIQRSLKCSVQ